MIVLVLTVLLGLGVDSPGRVVRSDRIHHPAAVATEAGSARGGAGGQQRQVGVPGEHESRNPHAHEWRVGMTALALDTELTPYQADCLKTVQSSAESLLTILNDILDFSKIESRKLELESIPFSLAELSARR
jgi:signal transduction histidine kinase